MTRSKYQTANYYARTLAIGLIIWFALLLTIGSYWIKLAGAYGQVGEVFSALLLLIPA